MATFFEEIKVTGQDLMDKVKEVVEEGNARRVIIKNNKGKTLLEVPLSMGVVGMGAAYVLAPFLSAISFFALYLTDCSIIVERYQEDEESSDKEVQADAQIIDIVEDEGPEPENT